MRRLIFLLLTVTSVNLFAFTRSDRIVLNPSGPQPNHSIIPVPADEPDVYYNNVSQIIIIDGTGEVDYYDVEIMSLITFDVVISTQVNGSYDTIDISALPDGEYGITIDAPTGNTFEGFFSTY